MPAERALAERLGLSRAALRRGLAALDVEGLLIRQVGRGTFLKDNVGKAAQTIETDRRIETPEAVGEASPRHMVVARLALEPKLARLAAREASARDVALLRETDVALSAARDWASFDLADHAFHRAVAAATANPILLHVFDTLNAAREGLAWGRFGERPGFTAEAVQAASTHHGRITAAIAERDVDAAEAALTHHLMVEGATILSGVA